MTGCRAQDLSTRCGGRKYAEVAKVDRSNTADTLPDDMPAEVSKEYVCKVGVAKQKCITC